MSLLHADNFSLFGPGGHNVSGSGRDYALQGVYVQFGNDYNGNSCAMYPDPDPTAGGGSVVRFMPASGAPYNDYFLQLRKVLPAAVTTVGAFARLWWDSFAPSYHDSPMLRFGDSANTANIWIAASTVGSIKVMRGPFNNAEATVIAESVSCLTAAGWHHIEAKITFDNSAGSVEVYVNGRQVIDEVNVDTVYGNANCQTVSVGKAAFGVAAGGAAFWKDFVIYDTSGTVNNDIFGTCAVAPYFPNSDVDFPWTASTGAVGYSLIDEVPPVDSDYISAGDPPPDPCIFGMQNVPSDVTSIRGLVAFTRMTKSDGGDCSVQVGLLSNGDDALGEDRQITTAFTYWTDVFELDPDTGFPFTPIAFNAVTATINRTI